MNAYTIYNYKNKLYCSENEKYFFECEEIIHTYDSYESEDYESYERYETCEFSGWNIA